MPKYNIAGRRSYCVYRRCAQNKIQHHSTAQGFGSVGVFLFSCIILMGVLYLFSTNESAIKGDDIYTIEKEIRDLSRENEQLMIQEAQLRSLESVENVVKERGMEEIVDPMYIDKDVFVALEQ